MSIEKNKRKRLDFEGKVPNVEIKQHPQEILELDDETVAIGRAKLAGVDLGDIYGDEDRTSPELMIRTQAMKIRELFRSPSELKAAFSSERKIEEARKDMMIDGIDLEFVKSYCRKKQLEFSDDAEALVKVGFEYDRSGDANV